MSFQNPDRISIEVTKKMEVVPQWAIMDVIIEGESSFSREESFKKAKEVAQFVLELGSIEFPENNISLENVVIKTNTGVLIKSSTVKFSLRLDKIPLKLIPSILAIVAQQKNISIQEMNYFFGELKEERAELMDTACLAAKEEGKRVCSNFGVDLLGIYSMCPMWLLPSSNAGVAERSKFGISRQGPLDGLEIVENKKEELVLTLNLEFRVGGF